MFRVHYRPPEALPSHQRDFPPRQASKELPGAEGSNGLALMVAWYVAALIAGIVFLGHLTATTIPQTATAETIDGRW
jgi:hypothetical protein